MRYLCEDCADTEYDKKKRFRNPMRTIYCIECKVNIGPRTEAYVPRDD